MSNEEENDEKFAEREAVCRRCGICCHHKVKFGDVVVITDIPCEFLDTATNACTVYPHRFIKQPLCSTAEISAASGTLPDTCPYVAARSDYRPPLLLASHPEYQQAVDTLFPDANRPRPQPRAGEKARRKGEPSRRVRGRKKPF